MDALKIKPLTKDQILISIDRLTRFKDTETKYIRVFSDILTSNLIFPKYKRNDIENMNYNELKNLAQHVINFSIDELGLTHQKDNYIINQRLFDYEKSIFEISKETEELLKNKIHYDAILPLIDEGSAINLRWLKAMSKAEHIKEIRAEQSLHFPIEKIVIAEGATEEVLLPEFARLCNYDFDKNGIHIISAGGKNQVVKLYYKLADCLKLPIFVLLDQDAKDNLKEIEPKLREIDKIHLLDCGEFEDLLSLELVRRTLDYELSNISIVEQEILTEPIPRAKILEEIFKTRGMHEFKKVEFAQMVKNHIKTDADISPEIINIIDELRNLNAKVTEFKEK